MMSVRTSVLGLVSSLFVLVGVLVFTSAPALAETCPNEQLRAENNSTNLPDCRAYEQVTPVEKGGGLFGPVFMGVDGEGNPTLITNSFAAIDGLAADENLSGGYYSTVRTGSGWVTSAMSPPASEYQIWANADSLLGGSLDGRSGIWTGRRDSWAENRVDLLLTRPGGAIEDAGILTPPDTAPGTISTIISLGSSGSELEVLGWSDDLSHIVYKQKKGFWPFDRTLENTGVVGGAGNVGNSLYELVGVGNAQPLLVGVGNDGRLVSECGTVLGSSQSSPPNVRNAVSADGSVVFFTALGRAYATGTAPACGVVDPTASAPAVNELYARVDNGEAGAHTVAISEPAKEDCALCDTSAPRPPTYEGASADGSKVFFETEQPLLGSDRTSNLYEYDFDAPAGERVVRVSGGDSTVGEPAAEVQGGPVAISEDGSHVYFVARGVLTTTPNSQGETAYAGANNLYVFEHDEQYPAGRIAFIADLAASDESLWQGSSGRDVTPDGQFLVFASTTERLTPDDTSTVSQVFEYDAGSGGAGSLTRVSIGQDGYNDNGNTDLVEAGASIPSTSGTLESTAAPVVSADGSYVFFQSTDGLTPRALDRKPIGERITVVGLFPNEKKVNVPVYANNIYEYHDGNVYLISGGRDVSESPDIELSDVELVGADESGADVLFKTVDPLTPTDIDSNLDVYDARIDGGFPAPVAPVECSEDACQGSLSPAPTLLSPGSEFQAGGNPPPAVQPPTVKSKAKSKAVKCKRGYVIKQGKCVKKPKTKKKRKAGKSSASRGRK